MQSRILPDNAYGDLPPVQIERNLQQEMDPIQEESSSMQAKPSQSAQVPTNEEEDLGQMYSSQWIRYHFTMVVESAPVPIPKQCCDILKMDKKEQEQWNGTMKENMKSLHERKIWDLVNLPKGHQPIKGKWVYAVKSNGCKKACFIAKGFTQVFRIDYENTFLPVARFEILQLLLSLAVLYYWELEALDVKTTFYLENWIKKFIWNNKRVS